MNGGSVMLMFAEGSVLSDRRRLGSTFILLVLFLVASGCSATSSSSTYRSKRAVYHVIKKGETLASVAQMLSVSEDTLLLLNKIEDPKRLQPGKRLLVGYRDKASKTSTSPVKRASYAPQNYQNGLIAWPVRGGWLASEFGPRDDSFHDGVDIAAPIGTPIVAAHDGEVIYSGNELSGYGNLLIVKGRDKLMTIYAHSSQLLVRQGSMVKRGQVIAEVGATGRASGPHLHFEVRMKDKYQRYVAIDPLPLLERKKELRPRFRVNESLTPIFARLWR